MMSFIYINHQETDVPAWIQAITSLVGLIFLLKTFRLQRKATEAQAAATEAQAAATKDQADIAKRDHSRFMRENEPLVEVSVVSYDMGTGNGELEAIVKNNPAFDLTIASNDPSFLVAGDMYTLLRRTNSNESQKYYIRRSSNDEDQINELIGLSMKFRDRNRYLYEQNIIIDLKNLDVRYDVPRIVSEGGNV